MASKFVQAKGRYFFLSNSAAVYSPGASLRGTVRAVQRPQMVGYFFNNTVAATVASTNPTAVAPLKQQLGVNPGALIARLMGRRPTNPQMGIMAEINYNSLTQAGPRRQITIMDTIRGALYPSAWKAHQRSYATFRDLGYRGGRSSGSGGSSRGSGVFQYLKVPLLFTIGVCAFNAFVLPYMFQIPGMRELVRHPQWIVYGLIGLNVAVFLAWKTPRSFGRQLYRYGLLHKDAQFNKWQMIGSAFSHQEFWHLGINMFVLYQFGGPLSQWVGSKNFLEMYLDSAVVASLGSIALPVLLNRFTPWIFAAGASNVPSLGASGAIFSIFGTFSYLVPYTRLSLFFVPLPIGAWYVFLLTMGYNGLGIKYNWARTDYAGHFAGCAAGIVFGYIFTEKIRRQRQEQQRRLASFRVF
ncbi:uncharacterized protein SAPINGB_P002635 [Magnusiomyces paraingens]|uniref:Peptidase S54 rhomboid domain-containing protein n=1 Tax=Magnusiomyces paraingens TaxID=2606893 RepID=A0A5E8BF75_9ASCO|nr:uncharacterized protein SAPINGB_P002635 [Saprochaete ingens]VVT50169.1 unnamed protein product [Saprochaete ingens]